MSRNVDEMFRPGVADVLAAREADTAVREALARVTAAAVELIDGVDHAGVLLIEDDYANYAADGRACSLPSAVHATFRSVGPTSPLVTDLDTAQLQLQEGPCMRAAGGDAVIRSPDLANDRRWPLFGAIAAHAGARSLWSYRLYAHRRGCGALNLLGGSVRSLDEEAQATAGILAAHAATIMARFDVIPQQLTDRTEPMTSRDILHLSA